MTASLSQLPRRQIMLTLAGVMLAMFLSSLDQTVVGTAMPRIITDLGGFNQYTWVTTAYIITSAITIPIVGKLIDMYGRKTFYIIGLIIFLVFSLACGLSQTMTQIIIFRGAQGIGAGIMMANAFTAVADLFPPAERGKYQGLVSGVFALSSVIGPTLGGFLTDSVSWHWVFFINLPLGLVVIGLFIKFFPNFRPDNMQHKVDYPGVVLLILSFAPLLLALSWGGVEYPWGSPQIIGMLVFAAIMLVIFLVVESKAVEPILPLTIFRNNVIAISEIAIFFTAVGMFGCIILVPLFFQGILGASATASGNFLIPMMLGVLAGSFTAGQLLSRAGGHYRILAVVGVGIMAVGVFLLSRMTVNTGYSTVVLNTVITGLGLGVTMPTFTIAVQNAAEPRQIGVATSSTAFFRSIGGSVGLAILGSVMNNRFAAELQASLPTAVKNAVPASRLDSLFHNPQALVNPAAQSQLKTQLGPFFDQIFQGLHKALSLAIADAFLVGLFLILIGLLSCFFIKEIPLRKTFHR